MLSNLTDNLGPGFVLVVALMWLALVVATIALPFVLFSIAGNLRAIRRALERAYPEPASHQLLR